MKFYRAFVKCTDPKYFGTQGYLSQEIFANEEEAREWWKNRRSFEEGMINYDKELGRDASYKQKSMDCYILAGLTEVVLDKVF